MHQQMSGDKHTSIMDLSFLELEALLKSKGHPAFRARQVFGWLYREMVEDFGQMSNLPKSLRDDLSQETWLRPVEPVSEIVADDKLTRKALLRLRDGVAIEAVLMSYPARPDSRARRTVCVSSQAGCGMGCAFCATGKSGLVRNLTSGEIAGQVLHFARHLPRDEGVTNVVVMGMGEPLANYGNLWKAITTLNSPYGFGLGARHFTISTVGLVPKIRELARANLQVGLAVSLHAPNDELRSRLLPVNATFPLRELLASCREYVTATNRRITFEYSMIQGVNDGLEQAEELATLLKGVLCHVNLIALNEIQDTSFRSSSPRRVEAFEAELLRRGIQTTIRASRGGHIAAACGQLAASKP